MIVHVKGCLFSQKQNKTLGKDKQMQIKHAIHYVLNTLDMGNHWFKLIGNISRKI